jgi:hypothetical protein
MISLRHHIFSLVAVFVALAIGIAAGSTVVRGPLLDSLRARVESAETLIEDERAENDDLAAEVAQLDQLGDDAPDQLLPGRLDGSAVLLLVAGDVDPGVVDGLLRSIDASSAELVGEIRIAGVAFDPEQAALVAEALDVQAAADADGADVADALGADLARRLRELRDGVATSAVTRDVVSAVFGDLEDEGVVDLLRLRGEPLTSESFDVVLVVDRNVDNDPGPVLRTLVDAVTTETEGTAVEMIIAEAGRVALDDDATSPSFVGAIRDSGRLRDEVSTVDNAETVLGWIATVLGLQTLREGDVGHYGFRNGAERSIPAVSP